MGRRAKEEGSLYAIRDKTGKIVRYAAALTVGYRDGKRIRKKVEAKTRAEVARKLAELKRQHTAGINVAARPQTVRDYGTRWLDDEFGGGLHSSVTYRRTLVNYVYPTIGDMILQTVSAADARKMRADLKARGYSNGTITLAWRVAHQVFAHAVGADLMLRNPFAVQRQKRSNRRDATPPVAKALTVEQARTFQASARGERQEVGLRLSLGLGFRRGEICGLRLCDVDMEAGTITIAGSLEDIPGHGLTWDEPKSAQSKRTLKLPAALLAALTWHLQQRERESQRPGWEESGYVFTGKNGRALHPGTLYAVFCRVAARAGLEGFRLHDLRHSCASFLFAEGVPMKTISAILGHASTAITEAIYVHLFQEAVDAGVEAVEDRLERKEKRG